MPGALPHVTSGSRSQCAQRLPQAELWRAARRAGAVPTLETRYRHRGPEKPISAQGRWRVNSAEASAPHCSQRPSSVRRSSQDQRKLTCGLLSADAAGNKSPPHPSDQSLAGGRTGPQPRWARQASRGWGRLLEANRPSKSRAAGPLGKLDFIPSSLLDSPELPCQPLHGGERRLTDTAPTPPPPPGRQ